MNLRLVITLLKWPVLQKEMDPTRLVHYEGDFEGRGHGCLFYNVYVVGTPN